MSVFVPLRSRGSVTSVTRPYLNVARRPVPILLNIQKRYSAHSPLGISSSPPRKKVTINTLRTMHKIGDPITMLTAHDFPSEHAADTAGMDIILVGDSLAMVALGMEDTSEVMVDEMLLHCKSVARATKAAFTVSNNAVLILSL